MRPTSSRFLEPWLLDICPHSLREQIVDDLKERMPLYVEFLYPTDERTLGIGLKWERCQYLIVQSAIAW